MADIEEYRALRYLLNALGLDDDEYVYSYSLNKVKSKINLAPLEVKQFLWRYCGTLEELENYLNGHEEYFWVENGKVSIFYQCIQDGSDKAVSYFEDIIDSYETLPDYKNCYGHLGQADEDVKTFMRLFYSGDFKQFLLNHSDVFVVFNDETVSLIENEAVNYFQQRLREGREGWYYMNLRGCIGQAPKHIIEFINDSYFEEDFLTFLEDNSYAFEVDADNCVYLN